MLLASRASRLYARKGGAGICGRLLSQSNKPVTKNSPSRAKDIIISGLSITVVLGALYLFETKKKEAAKVKSISKSVGKVFQIQSLESLLLMLFVFVTVHCRGIWYNDRRLWVAHILSLIKMAHQSLMLPFMAIMFFCTLGLRSVLTYAPMKLIS